MKNLVYVLVTLFCFIALSETKSPSLQTYKVDKDKISISGFSSGGYFAVQFHVAFSKTVMGAGVMAGGPYYCTEGRMDTFTLWKCAQYPAEIDVRVLVDKVASAAKGGHIDDPSHIKNHNVFIFSGFIDTVVVPGVVRKTEEFYKELDVDPKTEFGIPAEHGIVTDDYGMLCSALLPPYINNCGYSTPYHILSHIYGNITYANSYSSKLENLLMFDQKEFFSNERASLDDTGYVYVPSACRINSTSKCRLHVAFHGCEQGKDILGPTYALHSEYNGLAERNNIIILYPQTKITVINPSCCWDMSGYTDPNTYVYKDGLQPAAVMNMIKRVAGL